MNKKILIIIGIIMAIILGSILSIRFMSPEDSWVCKDGIWVEHGSPAASAPNTPCKK